MERNKKKNPKTTLNNGNGTLIAGIGIGAVLLVLAEIFCVLSEIYYMLSGSTYSIVLIISVILLLGTTAAFLYIIKNVLAENVSSQDEKYDQILQISKATYMKTKKLSGQVGEDLGTVVDQVSQVATGIRDDITRVQQKQAEESYKRQMAISNVQIKRSQENMLAILNSNDHMIEAIEEKLQALTELDSFEGAVRNVQDSVDKLYELCEKIAQGQENAQAYVPTEPLIQPEEPVGVNIEPLPEDVVERLSEPELTFGEPEPVAAEPEEPEMDSEPEPEPEIDSEPEPVVAEPEPQVKVPEMDGDPNRQLTPEEIAALFSGV